ncbi:molybdopterin oxidoreductase family protein [Ahrensia sp. R2A130]|uniref:molybdopterin oxidoreductase family protein n=1 Tax=Ahrensia sp. R2A130 TaxID=744979 RepID=UPI0001E0941D|nr:molybdopterin oxidoreductase family protein [Ahrensia sp. R2A130]EFL90574.1 molybdopterin oxidoreductase [Ahrensia sp. R2A130]
MNKPIDQTTLHMATACPHDCPSTCALEVEVLEGGKIGRVRGSKDNTYTDGVICAKVARYAERVNHPDRLLKPVQRAGAKGAGEWRGIDWDDALDLVAEKFLQAEQKLGAETVWPYFYAGTMGLVQRDSIQRLRHAKGYSQQFDTICVNPAWSGFSIGTGRLMGPDPREMAVSDCVVIWGTNAVATQVNVMTHAVKARKSRGAKIVVIDIYENATMKQADLALLLRPGTDGALACAVMHCLFRDGTADRAYMAKFADCPDELEAHLKMRTPQWASEITGLPVEQIEEFAALLGNTPRSYLRLGYGFTRSRNGTTAMHAASSIATVLGAWQHKGGGAFHSNSGIFKMDGSLIQGDSFADPNVRALDQSQIGQVLTGDAKALRGGPPVTAMLIQNTNPMNVAPEQNLVREGFAWDDLFVAVHEQFMTDTAAMADLVLPATMFVEHDDIYRGGGHQHILLGPKLVDGPELCRTNFFVIEELAKRLGVADHDGFGSDERSLIDDMLKRSNRGSWNEIHRDRWIDCQPDFRESHYLDGFAHADGKFHFKADWNAVPWGRPPESLGVLGPVSDAPMLPDHWAVTEEVTEKFPFRLATSPARSFLNSTFAETTSSRKKEGRPTVLVHPDDAASLGIADGDAVQLESARGTCQLHAEFFEGVRPGVLVSEGIYPNSAHADGKGLNSLTGADPVAPHGGAAFHDNRVRLVKL